MVLFFLPIHPLIGLFEQFFQLVFFSPPDRANGSIYLLFLHFLPEQLCFLFKLRLADIQLQHHELIAADPVGVLREYRRNGLRRPHDQIIPGAVSLLVIDLFQSIQVDVHCAHLFRPDCAGLFDHFHILIAVVQASQCIVIAQLLQVLLLLPALYAVGNEKLDGCQQRCILVVFGGVVHPP